MNNWIVIYHERKFIALTSDEWNEDSKYNESCPIEFNLTKGSAMTLENELNFALECWKVVY